MLKLKEEMNICQITGQASSGEINEKNYFYFTFTVTILKKSPSIKTVEFLHTNTLSFSDGNTVSEKIT